MNKRKVILGSIGALILAGGVLLAKHLSERDNSPPEIPSDAATVVNTLEVNPGRVESRSEVTGRLIPADKIDLFAEVGGIANFGSKPFKTGVEFRKGEILLSIDRSEFYSALVSQKSQFTATLAGSLPDIRIDYPSEYDAWQKFLSDFDIQKPAPALPEIENKQLKLFLTGRGIISSYYKIQEAEKRLSKFTIRAPFNGTLTESYINEGTLVRIGQQLGEFINTGSYELEASLDNNSLQSLEKGTVLDFSEVGNEGSFKGKLIRVNQKLDPGTQLIKVYFSLVHPDLKSGMYLEASLPVRVYDSAVKLPLSSLVDGTFVYEVENGKAVKRKIALLEKDTEWIVVSGLKAGAKIITDRKNSAFEGREVIEL